MLIVIGTLLFIYLLIQFSSISQKRKMDKKKNEFWNREYEANSTRKADISGLDYITIPLDTLPFAESDDEKLNEVQNQIRNLSKESILNLTGLSNTDLKLQYGVANFNFLMQCDENYTQLVQAIYKWGSYLYEQDKWDKAITVLEYGIQIKTDISKNYILLANLYKSKGQTDKINNLIETAETLDTLTKDNILAALKKIQKAD